MQGCVTDLLSTPGHPICGEEEYDYFLANFETEVRVPRYYGKHPDRHRHVVDWSIVLGPVPDGGLSGSCNLSVGDHVYFLESVELLQCNGTHNPDLASDIWQCRVNGKLSKVSINAFGRTDKVMLSGRPNYLTSGNVECWLEAVKAEPPVVSLHQMKVPKSPFSLFALVKMNSQVATTARGNRDAFDESGNLAEHHRERANSHWPEFKSRYQNVVQDCVLPNGTLTITCTGTEQLHFLLRVSLLVY